MVYYVSGNRTWQSTNLGVTFTPVVSTGSYMAQNTIGVRFNHAAVIYSPAPGQDTIVVLGGQAAGPGQIYSSWLNDVWSSTNYGVTWTQKTAAAAFPPRQQAMVAVSQSGVMAVVGGMAYVNSIGGWWWYSDTWASLDGGSTWWQLSSNTSVAGLGGVAYGAIHVDANGFILTSGGMITGWSWSNPYTYRSTYSLNNIQQWLPQINSSAVVPAGFCPVTPGVRTSSSAAPRTSTAGTAAPATANTGTPVGPGATSTPLAPPTSSSSSSSSGLSNGAIAGIVIGSVVGALLLLLVVCFFFVRTGAGKKDTPSMSPRNAQRLEEEQSRVEASSVQMESVHADTDSHEEGDA